MSKINYICLDDKPSEVGLAVSRLSRSHANLNIKCETPLPLKDELKRLKCLRKGRKLDGLIVDLRLDQTAPAGQIPVNYKAQQLASQLHTAMAERLIPDFPIVLWSITQKLARSFDRDLSSHTLFDLVINKEKLLGKESLQATNLVSLVLGYRKICMTARNSCFWREVLSAPHSLELDHRIGESLTSTLPAHILAKYILDNIIWKSGPLIDQSTLCARLGITEASFRASQLAKALLRGASYKGAFCDAWPRWWWANIEKWWQSKNPNLPSILSLTAQERVDIIKKVFKVKNIVIAQPVARKYSKRFTTICQCTMEPLDPIDGFMLSSVGLEPWHDRLYVSTKVALQPRKHRFEGQLDAKEIERLKPLRKMKMRNES